MLSLPPNERTGDCRDKPTSGTHFCPYNTVRTSNCLSRKVSPLFFTCVLLSISFLPLQVLSHFASLIPLSPTMSHSWRVGGLFIPKATHTLIHTHTQNHCPGIGGSPHLQCPIMAPMCQAKHQYAAP